MERPMVDPQEHKIAIAYLEYLFEQQGCYRVEYPKVAGYAGVTIAEVAAFANKICERLATKVVGNQVP